MSPSTSVKVNARLYNNMIIVGETYTTNISAVAHRCFSRRWRTRQVFWKFSVQCSIEIANQLGAPM